MVFIEAMTPKILRKNRDQAYIHTEKIYQRRTSTGIYPTFFEHITLCIFTGKIQRSIVEQKKLKQNFKGQKPAFSIHILILRASEYCLIKALPELQEATLQLLTTGIFCTGFWKRNHIYLHFDKIAWYRERGLFPTENLIQLINENLQKSALDFLVVYMKKGCNTSIGSHLVNKTDKCYLLCKTHLLGEKYSRNMVFRGHISPMN